MMKSMKKLFCTPKKAILSGICILGAAAVLGTGTAYAVSSIAENSSIGAENAKNFAFANAGVDPISAEGVRAKFDFEKGSFVYEVEFSSGGIEYEYLINASDGSVLQKEMETLKNGITAETAEERIIPETAEEKALEDETAAPSDNIAGNNETGQTESSYISADKAKSTALSHAGLNSNEVVFTKVKLETDDGLVVYEIEFCKDRMEYEYTIDALTNRIVEFDSEWDD